MTPEHASRPRSHSPSTATPADNGCVLIVDDEEGVRETLREVVEMAGCSAILAINGSDALRLLALHRPCLMIVDLMMPVMTGSELLAEVKKHPALAKIPVVVATSAPGQAPPGVQVLTKPVEIDAIWDCMRRVCHCSSVAPGTV